MLKILRASYICMNGLTQLVSGYSLSSGHSQERQNMIECYERSAHVIKIKLKRRKFELEGPTLAHFVLRNEEKFSKKPKLLASGFIWAKIGFECEFGRNRSEDILFTCVSRAFKVPEHLLNNIN